MSVAEKGALCRMRKEAAHRRRRIVMNNDGNDCRHLDVEPSVESFLNSRTAPLVGSQVDAIFYCTGVFNSYTHQSEETELRKHADQNVVDWAWKLINQGTDALGAMTEFAHGYDMEVFVPSSGVTGPTGMLK